MGSGSRTRKKQAFRYMTDAKRVFSAFIITESASFSESVQIGIAKLEDTERERERDGEL